MTHDALLIALSSFLGVFVALGISFVLFRKRYDELKSHAEREAMVAAREEALRLREGIESDLKERKIKLETDEQDLADRVKSLKIREEGVNDELARYAGLSQEDAQNLYFSRYETAWQAEATRQAKESAAAIAHDAQRHAKGLILDAVQRSLTDYLSEASITVVEIASEDIKGKLIGREGRNIRAFEQTTGVDLIIDDTPGAVVVSSFDPVRRERARLTLVELIKDGRIHPARIEELHEKAGVEVDTLIRQAGETAAENAHVAGLPAKALEALGALKFRASYGQNVLDHSVEVSRIGQVIADELGLDRELTKRACLLHDIGKGLGTEWEGPHALAGMAFLRTLGESEPVLNAVGAHHREIEPATSEALVVIVADALSAARPGARRESLDQYIKRLTGLEQLALSFPGVERVFAVQAGREIRLLVKPEEIDDLGATQLANDVAFKIEQEMSYPGQVKVTVIRETRFHGLAR